MPDIYRNMEVHTQYKVLYRASVVKSYFCRQWQ